MTIQSYEEKLAALVADPEAARRWLNGIWDRKERDEYAYKALSFVHRNFKEDTMQKIIDCPWLPASSVVEAALRLEVGQPLQRLKTLADFGAFKLEYLPPEEKQFSRMGVCTIKIERETLHYFVDHFHRINRHRPQVPARSCRGTISRFPPRSPGS